ncbi:hypothetical protein MYX75_09310 [Acidobacteria bacterium AH-259-A15]|nr:hypothetical protein [Acidobacteria bacterium AH-259-A15]
MGRRFLCWTDVEGTVRQCVSLKPLRVPNDGAARRKRETRSAGLAAHGTSIWADDRRAWLLEAAK